MSNVQRYHSEWCDRMNGGPECNCEAGDSVPAGEGMSEREKRIRIHCSSERFNVSAVDVLYLLGVIDVIRGDRQRLRKSLDESEAQVVESQKAYNHQAHCAHLLSNQLDKLKSALETLSGCFPDRLFVYGAYGENWSEAEPDVDEFEVIDFKEILGEE